MTLVVREDLTKARGLSKTELGTFDICNHKAWFQLHYPAPFVPNEKMAFGSALDAGVEAIVKSLSREDAPKLDDAMDHAHETIARDEQPVDPDEVQHALARFLVDVAPIRDWTTTVTQPTIRADIEGLGPSEGHPDLLDVDEVWDVKGTAGKSAKDPRSVELGFYVLLCEASGQPISKVGYMEWRRGAPNGALVTGKWLTPSLEVTTEFRRWSYERAAAYVRAKKADKALNAKATNPGNYSFPNGPKWPQFCDDCPFSPKAGGPCLIASREEVA